MNDYTLKHAFKTNSLINKKLKTFCRLRSRQKSLQHDLHSIDSPSCQMHFIWSHYPARLWEITPFCVPRLNNLAWFNMAINFRNRITECQLRKTVNFTCPYRRTLLMTGYHSASGWNEDKQLVRRELYVLSSCLSLWWLRSFPTEQWCNSWVRNTYCWQM